jgi:hypothetical protein
VSGIRLANEALVEEQRRENHHLVTVENDHGEETTVIVELPKTPNQTMDPAGLQPFEETASFRRFRVTAPPRSRAEVTIIERWHDAQRFEYMSLSASNLKRWMADRFLDETTVQALASVVAEWNDARSAEGKRAKVESDHHAAYEKQSKISEQLGVLKEGGAEGNLRLRYVRELEAEQDRVNACEAEMARLADVAVAARKRAQDKLEVIVAGK